MVILENEPLAKYTSWRIGGPARSFAAVPTSEALIAALGWAAQRGLPVCILGGGTNILARDAGFPGLVLRYRAQQLRVDEATERAWVAAGAPMAGTARRLAAMGWAGLEWAEGLPGTIGGAVFGNAGCYGSDIAAALTRAWLLVDGETQAWPVERFAYGYRTSVLKQTTDHRSPTTAAESSVVGRQSSVVGRRSSVVGRRSSVVGRRSSVVSPIVLAAEFRVVRANPAELAERMRRTAVERKSKTPVGSSCGSVFKNPPDQSAGRLIEAAGLKGARVGAAEISRKHANYIVNLGGAGSEDVLRLIEIARARVYQEFGIELDLEVQVVG
ncbi:MAG: UDP-N-acetylmuramate dehydrogenase [Roseiflexaceae bacterium]